LGAEKKYISTTCKTKRGKIFNYAVEQDKKSVDYKTLRLRSGQGNVFIVGAEMTGIPKNVLKKCDIIAEIPMRGKKESLNVSVACGIVLFRVLGV